MTVPETAIDLNYRFVAGEHKVWFSWKILDMQAISESKGVQALADEQFRFSVLAAYASHHLAARLGTYIVSQTLAPNAKLIDKRIMPEIVTEHKCFIFPASGMIDDSSYRSVKLLLTLSYMRFSDIILSLWRPLALTFVIC